MSFPIGSGAVPSAPIEEPSMPSVPFGSGAFPTTSFDLPPAYSSNPEPFQAPIQSSPIPIDACDLERNCRDRCYSESTCSSIQRCENQMVRDERHWVGNCCGLVCVLLVFVIIGVVASLVVLGTFE